MLVLSAGPSGKGQGPSFPKCLGNGSCAELPSYCLFLGVTWELPASAGSSGLGNQMAWRELPAAAGSGMGNQMARKPSQQPRVPGLLVVKAREYRGQYRGPGTRAPSLIFKREPGARRKYRHHHSAKILVAPPELKNQRKFRGRGQSVDTNNGERSLRSFRWQGYEALLAGAHGFCKCGA